MTPFIKKSPFHRENLTIDSPVAVVAGGAGFVGSFLSEALLLQGCQVICLDNLLIGRQENLANCVANPNLTFLKHDLLSPVNKIEKADYIFHLAGLEAHKETPSSSDLSLATLQVNAQGTKNLLDLATQTEAKFLLGSSLKVFEQSAIEGDLDSLLGKTEEGKLAVASLAEAKRFAELVTTEYYQSEKVNVRIVRLADVYGPRMNLEVEGWVPELFRQAIKEGIIKLPGDGSNKIHPTFVADVVYGLIRAMFASGTAGEVFSLINPREVSLLEFAQEIKKQIPKGVEIKFVAESEVSPFVYEKILDGQSKLPWSPKVKIEEGIQKTLSFFQKEIRLKRKERKETLLPEKKPRPRPQPKRRFLTLVLVGLALLLILSSPFWLLATETFLGAYKLKGSRASFLEGEFSQGIKQAQSARYFFNQATETTNFLSPLYQGIMGERNFSATTKFLKAGKEIGASLVQLGQAGQNAQKLAEVVFQNQPGSVADLVGEMEAELGFAFSQLGFAEAELKNQASAAGGIFGNQLVRLSGLTTEIAQARELILKAQKGVRILPSFLGLYQRQSYLVLLQNNMELRPTGGFIGSFAILTFEHGRFIDLEVRDVYSADGQLKGHVEPPSDLKKYLGEAGWYLRDSNWDPDFPTSAVKAAWFLEKEIGRNVDGVIGVDLFLAQRLLEAVGEIELPDFQEKITVQNLFERAEYHAEMNFFPGSTQKQDFLGSLARTLFNQIKEADQTQWLSLARGIYQSLKEKDLLFYLDDSELMTVISGLGWDGRIRGIECRERDCLADYLMLVETNVGVNKANYFVDRKIKQEILIDDGGSVWRKVNLSYRNQSQAEVFPGGTYKNYLRLLFPPGSELDKVKISNEPLSPDQIEEFSLHGKQGFGFLIEVPIQETKLVEINYHLAKKVPLEMGQFQYLLYFQKQPGIRDEEVELKITLPGGWQAISSLPAQTGTGFLGLVSEFNQDLIYEFQLSL